MPDDAEEGTPNLPPIVILEHLRVAGFDLVRVVGQTNDEGDAHTLASVMADAGLRVWRVDLCSDDGTPRVERYVGASGAAWLASRGADATGIGAGDELTKQGR